MRGGPTGVSLAKFRVPLTANVGGWASVPHITTVRKPAARICLSALRVPDGYCMNQPWLTTNDWPVSALVLAAAK